MPKKTKTVPAEHEVPLYLFHEGSNAQAYSYFGAHRKNADTVVFRVWAPHAVRVSVVGDFNDWSDDADKMQLVPQSDGVWEAQVKGVKLYDAYKYHIFSKNGVETMKADPYGVHMETRPGTATKYYEIDNGYQWTDDAWVTARQQQNIYKSPVNIYEMHAGSWKRYPDGNFYSYRALADELVPYR